ncbi:hypothetical protein [Mycobacterium deserti]|uniref:Uncharacterized protein n=1 Tax=Mycobacterium deserti TaxID=2978347 RepID=A0ABT2MFB9_9MYCO|nr:hypothetical protein [Mycobacterium deserti]MCT7659701.1 hypothetical protein [Mycobacterium deserti]
MTNPWIGLDADTQKDKLYLERGVANEIKTTFEPYESSLETLIGDALDDTTGYFGGASAKNTLAGVLENAFNGRGEMLTTYLKEQLAQARGFVKTADDAAAALEANEGD